MNNSCGNLAPEECLKRGLNCIFERVGKRWSEGIYEKLILYFNEIERWNKRFGFVKASGNEVIIRHILDSIAPYRLFSRFIEKTEGMGVLDIGSGAGFPGIPLSIVFSKVSFTLVERMEKRARFLENMALILGSSNISVICDDLKSLISLKRNPTVYRYGIVTFRAFARVDEVLEEIIPLLTDNGVILAYKGRLDKVKEEVVFLSNSFSHIEIINISVPFLDAERHVLVLEKKYYEGDFSV